MENKFNILLVDDEQDFLDPIAFWMEAKGYAVRTASNGKDGLALIEAETPDLIFLDINMPVMDGIEALKNIRQKHKTLPVIMITANLEQLPVFHELGISGFFPKGGTLEQLEQLLHPILRLQARMKQTK